MKTIQITALVMVLIVLCGCRRSEEPKHIVILLDMSKSIDPKSRNEAFAAIKRLSTKLERGDQLVIVPITSDALVESSGRVLRFTWSEHREPYDADLRQKRADVSDALDQLAVQFKMMPGNRTDIFGALEVAREEFYRENVAAKRQLIILSDLIEDDQQFNFSSDQRLATEKQAVSLARSLTMKPMPFVPEPELAVLRSNELPKLSPERRKAIQAFWIIYLTSKTNRVHFAPDGVGALFER